MQQRGELRPFLAGVAAFLLPGLWLAVLMPFLAPAEWNPGDLPPMGMWRWMLMAAGISAMGAVFGSPVIAVGLVVWKLLHRLQGIRIWSFALTGLALGAFVGGLFGSLVSPFVWGYLRSFAASGLLTGLAVWAIAYAGRGSLGRLGPVESASG